MNGLLKLSFLTAAMVTSAAAFAQAQPPRMIGGAFDMRAALMSPAPLGPSTQFQAAVAPAEPAIAQAEPANLEAEPALPATIATPKTIAPRKTASSKPRQKPAVAARKPRSNPLESYATDTRRQTWPCRGGGGICAWSKGP